MAIQPGVYDQIITESIRRELNRLAQLTDVESLVIDLEEASAPDYLARHITQQIRLALKAMSRLDSDQPDARVNLVNSVIQQILSSANSDSFDPVESPPQLLQAIYTPPTAPVRPASPLSLSNLIMNSEGEPRLGSELFREMQSADSVLMLVSFIQWRGWQHLKVAFEELARSNKPVRILTTTYMGASDFHALQAIARLPNVQLRISLDGTRRRLHAKAWLFDRASGFGSAYVGSANLSGPALEDGIEWTVKLSQVEAPHIIDRFRGAFESMWADPDFESFDPDNPENSERIRTALESAKPGNGATARPLLFFDLKPHPYQEQILNQLEAERLDRGHYRNLVVAPTGTGKTLISAFDYKRQIPPSGIRPNLLFLAHREEILLQSRDAFRQVLRDESFGEMLAGGAQPASYNYLFSTIQSFQSRGLLNQVARDYWYFAVLDEAHHAGAESYEKILEQLRPHILLGLTATPERMDGKSILPWFDNRIADEMRIWHAIERQYLVPFDYYGIHDGTDLSALRWVRGHYDAKELSELYVRNARRANLVIQGFCDTYGNWAEARVLGFCVSVEHAEFMAAQFNQARIPSLAITSKSPDDLRSKATAMLRTREVNVLFTVDLFNEGVDIPEIDCVLFLRPTESSTVFLQQLGRGLRLRTGKNSCLALDFIGNQRREFRFDLKFSALFGGTRRQVTDQLESGITRLPGNCYFHLDKESRRQILENLKSRFRFTRVRLIQELQALAQSLGRRPSLLEFLEETQYDLADIYKPSDGGWAPIVSAAFPNEVPLTQLDIDLSSKFHHLLHIDSVTRIRYYQRILSNPAASDSSILERRMALMLSLRVLQKSFIKTVDSEDAAFQRLRLAPAAQSDFVELLEVLFDRIHSHSNETPYRPDWPLYLHRSYAREEILIAIGQTTAEHQVTSREGRYKIPHQNTEILFVTLDKSDKQFSPTTRYEDYAVSPTRFHWQSQSTTSESSNTGRNYIEQNANGAEFLLFIRPTKSDAFVFLGPVNYVSHIGSRPMSINWDLTSAMPPWLFERAASLRAA
jgi:superfamily II DNA or RNA helicase/HKD family nuclease